MNTKAIQPIGVNTKTFDGLTDTISAKIKPVRPGVYKAREVNPQPRTPFNWSFFKDGFWGPLVRNITDAEMEWELERVKARHGRKVPKRQHEWRGIEK